MHRKIFFIRCSFCMSYHVRALKKKQLALLRMMTINMAFDWLSHVLSPNDVIGVSVSCIGMGFQESITITIAKYV